MRLPNDKVVDILPEVFNEISRWTQDSFTAPESGGFILGYRHENTGNVSLEFVTPPQAGDLCTRVKFEIKDDNHKRMLLRARMKKSYYMGVWHTHPQTVPIPSSTDWDDWNDTLQKDRTACEYAFFLIAGTKGIKVWVGDLHTKRIVEIHECEKEGGLYKKV